jgi:DNA-binding IclR family transcriptional regulator
MRNNACMASYAPSTKASTQNAALRERGQNVHALTKGIQILDEFFQQASLSNAELVRRPGLPKATVSRLTGTLCATGYLQQDGATRLFSLGTRLFALVASNQRNVGLMAVARPHMAALAAETDLTVAVGTRDRLGVVFLEVARPQKNRLVINSDAGTVLPLESTAIGLAYLAAAGLAEKARLLEGLRRRHEDDWIVIRERIVRAQRDLLKHGFVMSQKSWGRDVSAVAAPLKLPGRSGLYSFNCAGAASQLGVLALQRELGPKLLQTVQRIREELARNPVLPLNPPSVHAP